MKRVEFVFDGRSLESLERLAAQCRLPAKYPTTVLVSTPRGAGKCVLFDAWRRARALKIRVDDVRRVRFGVAARAWAEVMR